MPSNIYICDTSSIINLHNNFPTEFRNRIEGLTRNNTLKIPEGVLREIRRKTDKFLGKLKK
jgi:hypothetical protein